MDALVYQEKGVFQIIAGWIGNALALFFFFSPAVIIYRLIKDTIHYKMIPYLLFIANILNCLLWFIYGWKKNDLQVYFCNSIGGVVNVVYLLIFWYYFAHENIPKYLALSISTVSFISGIFYFNMNIVKDYEVTGYAAMVVNIFMYAAPGQKIFEVFRTGNFDLIPIYSSVIGFLCSTSWMIYAICDRNIQIFVPNSLGIIFSTIQIGTWIHFYYKAENDYTNLYCYEAIKEVEGESDSKIK